MFTVEVPRVGRVSRLTFGCASVGGRVSERTSKRAMAEAFERGVTTFDVARSYGYGDAERILGEFLKGRRDRAQIITKAGIAPARQTAWMGVAKSLARPLFRALPGARRLAKPVLSKARTAGEFSSEKLRSSLIQSLRALRTDYVDALLLHACDIETVQQRAVRELLQSFVTEGLARRVGVASGADEALVWLAEGGDTACQVSALDLPKVLGPRPGSFELLLANQPFQGGALLRSVEAECATRGLGRRAALELLLRRPLDAGATSVVVSMLSPGHVHQAIDAMEAPSLPEGQRRELSGLLLGGA